MSRPTIQPWLRFAIFQRDGHTCQYCGAKAPGVLIEIDHVVPVNEGGSHGPDNLVTACFDCNSGKGSKTVTVDLPTLKLPIIKPLTPSKAWKSKEAKVME